MAPYGETNGRERGGEGGGGRTCDISAISEITGFEKTPKRGGGDREVGDIRCTRILNTRKQDMFWRIIFVAILSEYFLLRDLFFWIEVPGAAHIIQGSCLRERGLSVRPSQAEHEYACVLPSFLPSILTYLQSEFGLPLAGWG